MQQAKCRSCGAVIYWVRTEATDALMPIDAVPVDDGNVVLVNEKARYMKGDLFEAKTEGPRYKSHFATCPNAKQHRKKK